jgi:hypothetical protein
MTREIGSDQAVSRTFLATATPIAIRIRMTRSFFIEQPFRRPDGDRVVNDHGRGNGAR